MPSQYAFAACWQPNLIDHGPLVSLKFVSTSPTLPSTLADGFRLMVAACRNVWMCSRQTPCALSTGQVDPGSIHLLCNASNTGSMHSRPAVQPP